MSVVTPSHLEAKLRAVRVNASVWCVKSLKRANWWCFGGEQELGAAYVEAADLSDGCGQKFSLIVVHDGFDGQSLLERQRRVNECLKEEMTRIHALQMKTWTSAQYQQKMQQPVPMVSNTASQPAGEN